MKPLTITDEMTEAALVKWFKSETTWYAGMAPWSADQFRAEMKATLEAALPFLPIAVEGKEGWRPITSAPMDGKIVMLAWSPDDWTTGQGFYRDGKWVAVGTFYNHAAGKPPYEFRQITVAPVLWKDIGSPSSEVSK